MLMPLADSPATVAVASAPETGEAISSLAPGTYYVYCAVGRNGPNPDYYDLRIRAWADDTLLATCGDATMPLWEPKTAILDVDQVPTRIEISMMYTTDGSDWQQRVYEAAFEECADRSAWVGSESSEIKLCDYTIRENVARLTDLNGNERKLRGTLPLGGGATELTTGWYWANANIETEVRPKISGNVNIILDDDVILYYNNGIRLPSGSSLTIWSVGESGGTIYCDAANSESCAGIGGNDGEDAGAFTLNGGSVHTLGGGGAAGLGGGEQGLGGPVTVNRGYIEAEGGDVMQDFYSSGAGIGGGEDRSGGTVTINGGTVIAIGGGDDAAGIGGGADGDQGGAITINGGSVLAKGLWGAGIGGGYKRNGGSVTINGGVVEAESTIGACIGGGREGKNGRIVINGGKVTAVSQGSCPAAIGAGAKCNQGDEIIINGGEVTAHTYGNGAGIGGSYDEGGWRGYHGGKITITGGIVDAYSLNGAGIGGGGSDGGNGNGGDGGTVTITVVL